MNVDQKALTERFLRYVQIDTQSDPKSSASPTTEKQKDLSLLLHSELAALGLAAETDSFGYVYATIPSNSAKENVPVICFCSHVDTAPDCSGTGVQPILHENYNGQDIVLPHDTAQILSVKTSPYLSQHVGHSVITASGLTLLGADDKAGVAIIMQLAAHLQANPEIIHGEIKILFTPDEEVGKGTANLDVKKLGADYGYTLDGGVAGSLEDETFSADGAVITIHGVIAHPGYAKGHLINALKIAGAIVDALPKDKWSPETTEKMEGFVHPTSINGIAEKATVEFIVRDFRTEQLAHHHARLKQIAEDVVAKYPGAAIEYKVNEQYRNMYDILAQHPQVAAHAAEAIERADLQLIKESIRGGTDGSRLSYMGLPCPNIFTGMQNIHSKKEWVGVKDMVKAVETLIHLTNVWEERS